MTVEEAVEAARTIHPQVAIPMHIGRSIGWLADPQIFREKASVEVVILQIG